MYKCNVEIKLGGINAFCKKWGFKFKRYDRSFPLLYRKGIKLFLPSYNNGVWRVVVEVTNTIFVQDLIHNGVIEKVVE